MRGFAAALLSDPRSWLVLLALVALGLAATKPLARRTGRPAWVIAGVLISAAVVGMLTLSPAPGYAFDGLTPGQVPGCVRTLADPSAWWAALLSRHDRGERVGNVLMFVPVAGFAVLASRRPLLVGALGLVAPVAIELSQAFLGGGRDCAAPDWVNNATGAVLGALAGALVLWRLSGWGGGGPGLASTRSASAGDPAHPPDPPPPPATPPHAEPPDGSPGRTRDTGTS